MFVNLETLVYRYKKDMELLNTHPEYTYEQKELLKKRVQKHKDDIAEYVSSNRFSVALKAFNL